jgi:hypothetical protein
VAGFPVAYSHDDDQGGSLMTKTNGERTKDALLTVVGETQLAVDGLAKLLIAKGVITEDEWDQAQDDNEGMGISPAEWSLRGLDPEDGDALNVFFL